MRGWWQDLTDLVLPAECGGCGKPRAVLCPECRAALTGAAPRRVRPVPEPPGLPTVHAAAAYADAVRAALLAHKERGALPLAQPLGAALAGAVRAAVHSVQVTTASPLTAHGGPLEGHYDASAGAHGTSVAAVGARAHGEAVGAWPVVLVPVPSARRAVRARGHDPARRIALAAAGELRRGGMPARVAAVLRQRRGVADQAGLNSRQRLENLAGALEVAGGGGRLLLGARVVLVDDLMTTGASLAEAARAVREARGCDGRPTAVYAGVRREGMGEQRGWARGESRKRVYDAMEMPGANGPVNGVLAAVIAASPDSFEINRN